MFELFLCVLEPLVESSLANLLVFRHTVTADLDKYKSAAQVLHQGTFLILSRTTENSTKTLV